MGRNGWRGRVVEVEINSVLVHWVGDRHPNWIDRVEIYPLDAAGNPRLPGRPDHPQVIARRARITLANKRLLGS